VSVYNSINSLLVLMTEKQSQRSEGWMTDS
jgi:hypothetical protein